MDILRALVLLDLSILFKNFHELPKITAEQKNFCDFQKTIWVDHNRMKHNT